MLLAAARCSPAGERGAGSCGRAGQRGPAAPLALDVVPLRLNVSLQASVLARTGPAAAPLVWLGRWKPEAPVLQRQRCETSPVIHKLGGNKKKKKLVYNFHPRIHVLQTFFSSFVLRFLLITPIKRKKTWYGSHVMHVLFEIFLQSPFPWHSGKFTEGLVDHLTFFPLGLLPRSWSP